MNVFDIFVGAFTIVVVLIDTPLQAATDALGGILVGVGFNSCFKFYLSDELSVASFRCLNGF